MFTAIDKNGNKVAIMDAKTEQEYFCPVCNGKLQIKAGQVNAKHFAHISLQDCDDFSSDMSEWHRTWQEQFPLKNREVIIEYDGEKHRADVLACGYVIEFQHSPISCEEFNRRNEFYTKAGKKVVWVFDTICEVTVGRLKDYDEWVGKTDNGAKMRWLHSKKCFKDFLPQQQKNIILLFQLYETDFTNEEDDFYIERVVWASRHIVKLGQGRNLYRTETSFSHFFTSYYPGNKTELLDWIKNRRL